MKSRILALLLCLVMLASVCLMTACGKKKEVEITDETERTEALGSFLKGIDEIRKGGMVATGSVKGYTTEKKEDGSISRDDIDLTLALNYFNQTFDATASGTTNGKAGTFEAFFNGTVFATISTEGNGKPEYDVQFVSDLMGKAPLALDAETTALLDQILALIDLDKVAENLAASTDGILVVKKKGSDYVVSMSSDAFFDEAIRILNIVKNSGEGTVGELIDALLGEGTSEKIMTELGAISGTDKLVDLLPKLEAALSDLGIKVDAAYDLAAKLSMGEEATGAQFKQLLTGMLGQMTLDDGFAFVYNKISEMIGAMFSSMFNSAFGDEDEDGAEVEVAPMQSPEPAGEPAGEGEEEEEEEEESGAPTWAYIYGMIEGFVSAKVNDAFGMIFGSEKDETTGAPKPFDVSAEVTPIIGYAAALKTAIQFSATVTCNKKLVPKKAEISLSVNTTDLPAEMEMDAAELTLTINAEIKSSVTVAPSAALQTAINDETAKKAAAPAN
ncbi:MAG: hypothetical protein J6X72_00765 [Clostridia bacterium]|nr:hypothetical protein [Clostridia bacterium]